MVQFIVPEPGLIFPPFLYLNVICASCYQYIIINFYQVVNVMVSPVSLSFSIHFIGQHFKDKLSASISPNRHHHHALHKIALSLFSLPNGWSCGSISPGLGLFLWEENIMSHYKLTSDSLMSPPNNHTRMNRTKTAKSMGVHSGYIASSEEVSFQ